MPTGDPRDRFFYHTLSLMIDSYNLEIWLQPKTFFVIYTHNPIIVTITNIIYQELLDKFALEPWYVF